MVFDPKILKVVLAKLTETKPFWYVCDLGGHGSSWPLVLEKNMVLSYHLTIFLKRGAGGGGYLLTRKAFLAKSQKFSLPLDHFISRGWEFAGLTCMSLSPSIVTYEEVGLDSKQKTRSDMGSDIDKQGRRHKPKSQWKQGQRYMTYICHFKSAMAEFFYGIYIFHNTYP